MRGCRADFAVRSRLASRVFLFAVIQGVLDDDNDGLSQAANQGGRFPMKKILSVLLALAMLVSLAAFAEEAPTVYVSISDDTGTLTLAYAPVALSDQDGDGALTICDALM